METKTISSHYIGQYEVLVDYGHRIEEETNATICRCHSCAISQNILPGK